MASTDYTDRSLVRNGGDENRPFSQTDLKRDPEFFKKNLYVGKDRGLYTKVDMVIHVPERYQERHLATINGDGVFVLGIFAMVSGERYSVVTVNSMVRLTPYDTVSTVIDDERYLVFHFKANSKVYHSIDLVQKRNLVYYIYAEFVAKGKFPWFYGYEDASRLFESSQDYAGVSLAHPHVLDMMISMTLRDPANISKMYRQIISSYEFVIAKPPVMVPFKSILLNTHSTMTKLIGAYFSEGINSALDQPTSKVDRLEQLLRT